MIRVTDVLEFFSEPGLVDWKLSAGKAEAKRIGKQAMNVGSNVDEYVKAFINKEKLPKLKTKEAESCVAGFNRWYEDYGKPNLIVGQRIFDIENDLTGEPDIYWNETVIDIKCA